jgi:hypothetical protein
MIAATMIAAARAKTVAVETATITVSRSFPRHGRANEHQWRCSRAKH